jgi:hypothetical protein
MYVKATEGLVQQRLPKKQFFLLLRKFVVNQTFVFQIKFSGENYPDERYFYYLLSRKKD